MRFKDRAHAGNELNLVRLDDHAPPAPIALLAPRQLVVDVCREKRESGRGAFDEGHEGLPMRFAGGSKSEAHVF